MTTGDDLVGLLGATAKDPRVVDALKAFAIRWPPRLEEPAVADEQDWRVWRPSSANGFEFGFMDEAYLRALDPGQRGSSPLVLTSVCFYGEHEGVRPHQGELPFGILLDDSRDTVRKKLSILEIGPRVYRRDVWDAPKHRVVVEHAPSGKVDSVLVRLRLHPWPPIDPAPAKLPKVDEIVALFGQPWYGPSMRAAFGPLGIDACGPSIARDHVANLRRDFGAELHFFADPARTDDNPIQTKGAGFTSAKLVRARYLDARAWTGELPCGLELDIAYPDIEQRVGRRPDQRGEGKLSGYAVWELPRYTLHVAFDTVNNVIDAVTIFQPGVWQASQATS